MSGKRVAILGGGVSGCSSALHLSKLGYCVSLFEMGRGCGGRASSRKTRSQPNLVVNHGAPTFDVRTDRGREIVKVLLRNIRAYGVSSPQRKVLRRAR